jgi:hypothetical protein
MDTNTINTGNCAGGTGITPEPGTIALVATGGAIAAGANSSNFSLWGLALRSLRSSGSESGKN